MRVSGAILSAVLLGALASPAFANSVIHSANTEMGYTTHPDHAQAGKSRAEARAELLRAKSEPSWESYRRGVPPAAKAGAPLTRAQVEADLLRAQQHPSWSARRVGAPVTMN